MYRTTLVISATPNSSCIYTYTYCIYTYTHRHTSTQRNLFQSNHKEHDLSLEDKKEHINISRGKRVGVGREERLIGISAITLKPEKKKESERKRIIQREMNSVVSVIIRPKVSQMNKHQSRCLLLLPLRNQIDTSKLTHIQEPNRFSSRGCLYS